MKKEIIENIYNQKYASLKEDISKIISQKAVSVLEHMKVHTAKKFFSINEADSDDKSWDKTLDYARQGRPAPTVSTHTGQEYSGPNAVSRAAQDTMGQITRGERPSRDDESQKVNRPQTPQPAPSPTSPAGSVTSQPLPAPASPPAPPTPPTPPAARPAPRGPAQGVTGSEIASTSRGVFTNRADRMNQELVNRTLGRTDLRAGSAEANLALRDYYRQQSQGRGQEGPQPGVTPQRPAAPATPAAPESRAERNRRLNTPGYNPPRSR